jgi:hypothetical protein
VRGRGGKLNRFASINSRHAHTHTHTHDRLLAPDVTAEAALSGAAFGPGMASVDLVVKNEDEVDDTFAFAEIAK